MVFDDAVRSGTLSQSDLSVVAFIHAHPHEVVGMTSQELGDAAFVSASTVVRLCKKGGFRSFADMKVRLARDLADEECFRRVDSDFPELANASFEQVISTVSSMEREAIRKTERLLAGVCWEPIVEALDRAASISIFASGFSLAACEPFVQNLERIGKRVKFHSEFLVAQHWAAACPRDEFGIIVSYSGEGAHVEGPAGILAKRGIKSLSITSDADCPLRHLTTWHLPLALTERRQMYARVAPFQSTCAESYVLDVLYAMLFSRNYTQNARTIQRSLDMQGITVKLDSEGKVVLEGMPSGLGSMRSPSSGWASRR